MPKIGRSFDRLGVERLSPTTQDCASQPVTAPVVTP